MSPLPPLNALRVFEAAARHVSFTKAAEELHVTPGAVSQQIKSLEDYLGVRLFRRTKKALLLTDASEAALPTLQEGFDKLGEAARILRGASDSKRLAVSVAPSLAAKWLAPRLDNFRDRHPDIDVWISAAMQVVDFAVDDVDLAIRYGAGHYPGLEFELLMSESIVPVCSPRLLAGPNGLRAPGDLANHVLLHDGSPEKSESSPTWPMWLKAAGVIGVDGSRGPKFNQSNLVIEAAIAGKGVALAKRTLALADLESGRLVTPFGGKTPTNFSYYLVHPASKARSPAVRAFKKWLKEEARATDEANENQLRARKAS